MRSSAGTLNSFFILASWSTSLQAMAQHYADNKDLSYYLRPDASRVEIRTPHYWQVRRAHILLGMEAAMGPLPRPTQRVPLNVKILEELADDGFVRRKVAYHTDRGDKR